jgi:glycosyltransferase involved in cell wall biosynthesis
VKIALDALQVRAAKSGVGQYIHALTEALVHLAPQDDFTIYCTRQNVANYSLAAPNLQAQVWGLPESARSLRLLYQLAFLPGELKAAGFQLFHGMSNFLPPRKVCPYIVTIHDLSYYVDPQRCPPVRRRYWYAMTARTIELADIIIADSENTRRDIAHYFPAAAQKVRVVYIAAHSRYRPLDVTRSNATISHAPLSATSPYILYVGTLEPGKNVQRVIQAFDAIAKDFPNHQLLLAGDRGWLYEGIFAAAEAANASNRIRFLGHLPDEQIVELYNFCDLFVYPSLYEGFGLPPLEAMACGAPVVTSNTSSIPEVVGDAAIQVNPLSTDEIADAMRTVLRNPQHAAELRERGFARAAHFSFDRTAREVLELYRTIA